MPNTAETIVLKTFAERLIRIFGRNEQTGPCTCGRDEHLPDCPKAIWATAATLTRMELEDTIG